MSVLVQKKKNINLINIKLRKHLNKQILNKTLGLSKNFFFFQYD